MNHPVDYAERRESDADSVEQPISVTHFVHALNAYAPVILIAMLSVAIGYVVGAILLYVLSPAQRTTIQPFRLEFRGASEGTLPNGVRFSPIEIITTPVLLKVYQNDELARFATFEAFSRSVFILESNAAYEKLVGEYQARLSDLRLAPLDRERIQKEFELKRESISKSDFAIGYSRSSKNGALPETLVRKVLEDILDTWATFAINEQHALEYRVAVLSPQILDQTEIQRGDPIIAIQVLRSKIYRVIENIEQMNVLPGAELIKTADRMSLAEIRMRLEDIVRFRLEPLVGVSRASGLIPAPAVTVHFLQNQLAYDERRLQAAEAHASAAREALAIYSNDQRSLSDTMTTVTSPRPRGSAPGEGETVMPQLSDTFLDRLIALSKQAVDSQYRQKLIDEYRLAANTVIPLQQAVTYQKQVLDQVRTGAATGVRSDGQTVAAEINTSAAEVRRLIGKVNEVYQLLSRNLNPSTQLFSLAGPPTTRIERARPVTRLMLYGVLLLLVALPGIVILCLLHNRMREEETADADRSVTRAAIEEPV